jgi:hypothetical protein
MKLGASYLKYSKIIISNHKNLIQSIYNYQHHHLMNFHNYLLHFQHNLAKKIMDSRIHGYVTYSDLNLLTYPIDNLN